MSDLTDKQRLFVQEYLVDLNATQAAIRAGYSEATAYAQGSRLLKHVEIAAAIAAAQGARSERTEITQDYVLQGIVETIERCKQATPVLDHEGKPTGEYRFDANAALKGYDLLGRHLGIFKTEIDLNLKSAVASALEKARRRATDHARSVEDSTDGQRPN